MAHKIILKCRVCLDEFDEEQMFDLFKTGESEAIQLSEKVAFCCGVRIRKSTEMPAKICLKCFDMTRIWFNFRQMCVNSQVYLESLSKDRLRPAEYADDGAYLEYLIEDLQTFRTEECYRNMELAVNNDLNNILQADKDGDVYDSESEDEFVALSYDEADSDPEIEYMLRTIKKEAVTSSVPDEEGEHEREDEDEAEGDVDEETEQKIQEKRHRRKALRTNPTPRKSGSGRYIPKKHLRPPSPISYMCSICGNVYTKKSSFTYHMSLHTNVKPHECELCGKTFRQVCELKNHMRRHTGEKPYKCSHCDRHFIDRSERHRHERVHTNTRPYACNICGKSFMYSAILKNHSKLHSGEKNFNCLVCKKAFTLQHQLKAHLQTITHKQKEAQYISAGYEVVYE